MSCDVEVDACLHRALCLASGCRNTKGLGVRCKWILLAFSWHSPGNLLAFDSLRVRQAYSQNTNMVSHMAGATDATAAT